LLRSRTDTDAGLHSTHERLKLESRRSIDPDTLMAFGTSVYTQAHTLFKYNSKLHKWLLLHTKTMAGVFSQPNDALRVLFGEVQDDEKNTRVGQPILFDLKQNPVAGEPPNGLVMNETYYTRVEISEKIAFRDPIVFMFGEAVADNGGREFVPVVWCGQRFELKRPTTIGHVFSMAMGMGADLLYRVMELGGRTDYSDVLVRSVTLLVSERGVNPLTLIDGMFGSPAPVVWVLSYWAAMATAQRLNNVDVSVGTLGTKGHASHFTEAANEAAFVSLIGPCITEVFRLFGKNKELFNKLDEDSKKIMVRKMARFKVEAYTRDGASQSDDDDVDDLDGAGVLRPMGAVA
jgi:hypothetical protein